MSEISNAHSCPPLPEGLARGLAKLLDKRLAQFGLTFAVQAYIDKDGDACIQVLVDNDDDPEDTFELDYVVQDDSPDELYAQVKEDLSEVYEFSP